MTIHAAWPLLPFLSVWPPRTPPPICLLTGAGLSQADCLKAGCSAPAYKLLEKVVTSGGRHLGLPISLPSRFQLWPWKPGAPITQRTDIAAGELGKNQRPTARASSCRDCEGPRNSPGRNRSGRRAGLLKVLRAGEWLHWGQQVQHHKSEKTSPGAEDVYEQKYCCVTRQGIPPSAGPTSGWRIR